MTNNVNIGSEKLSEEPTNINSSRWFCSIHNTAIVLTDTDRTALAWRYSTECAVRWQGSAVRLSRQRQSLGVAEDEAALAATPRAVRSEPGAAVHHDRTVVRTGAVGL